ncbi:MAG TPA: nucleotide exchange factor GrpE, partial [Dehalococcoidales bacterium]|nr:nucleotide exchange factor GrpE [Dehalococcoidales bacterium]
MVNNDAAGEVTPEVSQDEYIASLKKALQEEKARAEANLVGWQRAQADFSNFKKYIEQEKQETRNYLTASIVTDFLPVLDDLDRAMAAMPKEESKKKWL